MLPCLLQPALDIPVDAHTHHFKPFDEGVKVGVLLVIMDQRGLHSLPCTLNVHSWPVHLGKVHSLQVPQTPEQHLGGLRGTKEESPIVKGGSSSGVLRRNRSLVGGT